MSSNVSTLSGVSMASTAFDARYAAALDVARSYLEGYSGDYLFFSLDGDTWVLLTDFENPVFSDGSFTADSCNCFDISVGSGSYMEPFSYTFSGDVGSDPVSGTLKGNVPGSQWRVHTGFGRYTSISISETHGYLYYASFDHCPHLIEGVQKYEFAEVFLLFIVFLVFSFDCIFRRVSR